MSKYLKNKKTINNVPGQRTLRVYGVIETYRIFSLSLLLHLMKDTSFVRIGCVQQLLMPGVGVFDRSITPNKEPLKYVERLSKEGLTFEL